MNLSDNMKQAKSFLDRKNAGKDEKKSKTFISLEMFPQKVFILGLDELLALITNGATV